MMITFTKDELLVDGRENLPKICNIGVEGRELDLMRQVQQHPNLPPMHDDPNGEDGIPVLIGPGPSKPPIVVRLVAANPEAMSMNVRDSQRLQFLALQVIVDKILPRNRLGFESNFAAILADLVDRNGVSRNTNSAEDREVAGPSAKRPRSAEESAKWPKPPQSFIEFQRIIRTNIFFSPYLKYHIHFRVSTNLLYSICGGVESDSYPCPFRSLTAR
jgi:hypothetical protein